MTGTATDPAGATGVVADWLAGLTMDAIPATVVERSLHITLDGLVCALVGAQLPWSQIAVKVVTELEGSGRSALFGWDRTTSPAAAALLNGTFIQGFELDDYHPLGPLHSASVVLPAAIAAVEQRGEAASGQDFVLATVAGYELGPRVGMALHGGDMISRGWHSGSIFGTHAAAAAAGVIYGLDADEFEDALGLAATQSSGLMAAQYEAMCKRMHHGFSARAGLYSAALAAGGFTGIKRVFERDYGGFLGTFGQGGKAPVPEAITAGLGEQWELDRISIKPYAAQGGTHAAIDAILQLQAGRPFEAIDVERIDVWVGHTVYHHGVWPAARPLNEIGAQMSMAYGIAVAVIDKAVMVEQFRTERINRDDVWELMPRIVAHHDEEIDRMGPQARLRTRLRVHFVDGSSSEVTVADPSGGLQRPLSNEQIRLKYRHLAGTVLEPERVEELEAAVLELATAADLSRLRAVLTPMAGSVLTG